MKAKLTYKNTKFELELENCRGLKKGFGLMFKSKENAKALLFDFKNEKKREITSLFVFFDFIAIWLDENNKIIEYRVIKPFNFSISPSRPFKRLIEVPINSKYSKIIKILVDHRNI